MISTKDLIAKFQYALNINAGYIYATTWEMWTAEKQAAYAKQYANDPDRQNSVKYGSKWIGHYVTDCSGLFAWAFKQLGRTIAHGSNSIWNSYCSAKGTLNKGLRIDSKALLPGTAVFTTTGDKHNHIGLYVGDDRVIEAMGAQNGVTTTLITNKKWTAWGELKGVKYTAVSGSGSGSISSGGGGSKMAETVEPGKAVVTGSKVALRLGPTTKAGVIARLDAGSIVEKATPPNDWECVKYNGQTGYMMKKFLKEG